MDALILGYVLTALACVQGDGAQRCTALAPRAVPTSLYVCQRAMEVSVERVPAIPGEAFGLAPGSYHFEFTCKPVTAAGHSL